MKCKYGELSDVAVVNWLLVEEKIEFQLMKFVFNGLDKINMPENLQLKVAGENRTHYAKIHYSNA